MARNLYEETYSKSELSNVVGLKVSALIFPDLENSAKPENLTESSKMLVLEKELMYTTLCHHHKSENDIYSQAYKYHICM